MLYVYISYRVYTSEDEAERLKKDTIRIVQRANKIMDKNAMKTKTDDSGASYCITCEDIIILESPKRLVSIIKLFRNTYQRLLYFYHKDDESDFISSNILGPKFANLPSLITP